MRGRVGDGYRDQIVTCDVGVSLHSKTHPLFMNVKEQDEGFACITEIVALESLFKISS